MKYEKGSFLTVPNKKYLHLVDSYSQSCFMWLCSFADEDGVCFPSRTKLASLMGCAERTVDRCIKDLTESGFIIKTERFRNNEQTTNLYQVLIMEGVAGDAPPGAGDATPLGQEMRTELNPIKLNPPKEVIFDKMTHSSYNNKERIKEVGELDSDGMPVREELPKEKVATITFSSFWEVWPKKVRKLEAMKAWRMKKLNPLLDEIVDFVEEAKKTERWKRGFIPDPVTFLYEERWKDDLSTYKQITKDDKKPANYLAPLDGEYDKYK